MVKARKLIDGSRKIDRMREEIKEVIAIIIGFIYDTPIYYDASKQQNGSQKLIHETFRSPNFEWILRAVDCSGRFNVKGLVKVGTGLCASRFQVYDSWENDNHLHLEYVQVVHENLDVFIDGMIELFPQLGDRLEPLFSAAKYAERD